MIKRLQIFCRYVNEKIRLCIPVLILSSFHFCSCSKNPNESLWNRVDPDSTDFHLTDLHFFNKDSGLILGFKIFENSPILMITNNGGNSWETIKYPFGFPEFGKIRGMQVINKSLIFGFSENKLILTKNYGKFWLIVDTMLPQKPWSIKMFNETEGCLGVDGGKIFKTNDGGKTWKLVYSSIDGGMVLQIVSAGNTLYARINNADTYKGRICKSIDMGNSWTEIYQSVYPMNIINFNNKDSGKIIIGCSEMCETLDGGNVWKSISHLNFCVNDNCPLYFVNSRGFIAGNQFIASSLDGGKNWNLEFNEKEKDVVFTKIQMVDENIGYAIDIIHGYIYKRGI